MKKILCLLALVLLIAGLTPWIGGLYIKQRLDDYLLKLNQQDNIKISLSKYHVGWYKSNADIKVAVIGRNSFNANTYVILNATIYHGPLAYNPETDQLNFAFGRIVTNLHLPEYLEKTIGITKTGLLQIVSLMKFNGVLTSTVSSPVITYILPSGSKLVWAGAHGNTQITLENLKKISTIHSKLTIGAINTELTNWNTPVISIAPIPIQYNIITQSDDLWTGSYTMNVPKISYINPTGDDYQLTNFKFNYENGVVDKKYHITEYISLDKLDLSSNFPSVAPAEFTIAAKNINYSGLQNFLAFSNSPEYKGLSPTELRDKSIELMLGLVSADTTIDSKASIQTSLGAFTFNGSLNWPKTTDNSLDAMKTNANVQLNARVAIPLITKLFENYFTAKLKAQPVDTTNNPNARIPTAQELTTMQLDLLVKKGFIVQENNDYVLSITHDMDGFKINGKIPEAAPAPTTAPARATLPAATAIPITQPAPAL